MIQNSTNKEIESVQIMLPTLEFYLPFRRFKLMFMQLKFPSVEFVEKTNEGQIHGKRLVTQLKAQNLYQEIKF